MRVNHIIFNRGGKNLTFKHCITPPWWQSKNSAEIATIGGTGCWSALQVCALRITTHTSGIYSNSRHPRGMKRKFPRNQTYTIGRALSMHTWLCNRVLRTFNFSRYLSKSRRTNSQIEITILSRLQFIEPLQNYLSTSLANVDRGKISRSDSEADSKPSNYRSMIEQQITHARFSEIYRQVISRCPGIAGVGVTFRVNIVVSEACDICV